ncbi:MAG: BON domain-containing protein [Actinomycetota bacterium]|nr:BON domain-containing protein [Actinomycetota bacterium]
MTTTEPSTDHLLKYAIARELDWASDVDNDRVGIAVTDGAVMLSGEVLSYPEKAAAVNAALRVRGVTALADEIIVRHAFGRIQDADIAQEATIALRNMSLLPTESVQATVHDHTVTLVGTVGWHHQRIAAAHAVSVLPGVIGVRNSIQLKPLEAMVAGPDAEANVTAALLRNAQLDAHQVVVTVSGTEIRLTGRVASWAARHQAEYAAWCTPGVTHVDNQVLIST